MISQVCQTRLLLAAVLSLATYILLFDANVEQIDDLDMVYLDELEEEMDGGKPVRHATYKSPLDESIFTPRTEVRNQLLAAAAVHASRRKDESVCSYLRWK